LFLTFLCNRLGLALSLSFRLGLGLALGICLIQSAVLSLKELSELECRRRSILAVFVSAQIITHLCEEEGDAIASWFQCATDMCK